MKKIVRRSYPMEVSIFLLAFIFGISFFFTYDVFNLTFNTASHFTSAYIGMFLLCVAVIIVLLIIWEELLFPVVVKQSNECLTVSNHRRKLRTQTLIYLAIPAIFIFIFFTFEINIIHFTIWACSCICVPVAVKIFSGIKNYNDFLKLSLFEIEYKNNEKEGKMHLTDIKYITLIKDHNNVLSKLKVGLHHTETIIDLDEMELEAYYEIIQDFVERTYKNILSLSTAQPLKKAH